MTDTDPREHSVDRARREIIEDATVTELREHISECFRELHNRGAFHQLFDTTDDLRKLHAQLRGEEIGGKAA